MTINDKRKQSLTVKTPVNCVKFKPTELTDIKRKRNGM